MLLAWFPTFALSCTGAKTLAQQNILVPVPGLEEITGSLEEKVFSIKYPQMKSKYLMSRHRKTWNIFN